MLKFIRKYQYSIMLVVAILVIAAFAWFYDPNKDAINSSNAVLKMGGRSYDYNAVQDLGRHGAVGSSLGLFEMVDTLSRMDQRHEMVRGEVPRDYVTNLLVLRDQKEELGIDVNQELIEERIKTLPPFQTNGGFDPKKWEDFEKRLRSNRIGVADISDAVGDSFVLQKAEELVTSAILPSPTEIDLIYSRLYETMEVNAVYLDRVSFEEGVTVSEEDIVKEYEENKESLLGKEQRQIRYVHFKQPEGLDKVPREERVKLDRDHKRKINEFSAAAVAKGADFAALVEASKLELLESPLFDEDNVPEAFNEAPLLVSAIFGRNLKQSTVSDPVIVGEDTYIFDVVETVAPQVIALDDAREQLTARLKERKISEALSAASEKAREGITTSLGEGKSFADAAAAAGVDFVNVKGFSLAEPDAEARSANQLGGLAARLKDGEVSQVLPDGAGMLFVHLVGKSDPDEAKAEERKKMIAESASGQDRSFALAGWFQTAKDDATITWPGAQASGQPQP